MPREVKEWIGASADTPVPPRVKLRVFLRANGGCQECGRPIKSGDKWICDHVIALINGGENRESNLRSICDWCDKNKKTPADVAEKSKTYHARLRHTGLKKPKGRPIPGSKRSGFKKKISGEVVKRDR